MKLYELLFQCNRYTPYIHVGLWRLKQAGLLAYVHHSLHLPVMKTVVSSRELPITVAGPRRIYTELPF